MLSLVPLLDAKRPLRLVCLGAHSDDLEIGCGGLLMSWLEAGRPLDITWVVLSAQGERAREARDSAEALLGGVERLELVLGEFRDGHFPAQYADIKGHLEAVKARAPADIVLTHRLEDRHQDHRLLGELVWNIWRDHLVLEYEIPKYEGDLGQPNVFVPLSAATARAKAAHLLRHFGSQRSKDWFSEETFLALTRLRGLECRAPQGHAEAFHARKLRMAVA